MNGDGTDVTATTDNGGNPPAGAQTTVKDPVPYERFSEVNKQLGELKKWKQEQETAAAERTKKEQDAEAVRLAKEGEYKTLAETLQQKLAELEPYKVQAEEANTTLAAMVEEELKNPAMSASTRDAIADMPTAKAVAFITKHKGEWMKAAPPNLNGAGGGQAGTELTDERKAAIAAKYGVKAEFIK